MIFITIIFVFLAITFFVFWDDWDAWDIVGNTFKIIAAIFLNAFAGFLALLLVHGVANIVTPYEYDSTTESSLVAAKTSDTVEGKFSGGVFASYGYVDGKRVISYISQEADGAYVTGYLDADKTRVYEVNDEKPYIETIREVKENGWFIPGGVFDSNETYKLYIPEGTIVESFEFTP